MQITAAEKPSNTVSFAKKVTQAQPESRQPDTIVAPQGSEPIAEAIPAAAEEPLSPKFAALARKEQFVREEMKKIQAKEAALEAERKKYETDFIPKGRLKEAAIEALKKGELSYDEFTQAILDSNGTVDPTIQKLEAKIAELEGKLTQTSTRFDENEKRAYDNAVASLKSEAQKLIESDPQFEMLKAYEMHEDVVKKIEDIFHNGGQLGEETFEKGEILTVEKVAKFLEEETFNQALKVKDLKKFQEKLTPAPATTEPTKPVQSKEQQPLKTLSHAVSASTKPLSPRERAILAFQGKLK